PEAARGLHSLRVLRTSDLDFELPDDLIATTPAARREAARLLLVGRDRPGNATHGRISDLPTLLRSGDLLVVNATRVLPARLEGVRADTGGRVEGLFLDGTGPRWSCMLRGKSVRPGIVVALLDPRGEPTGVTITPTERDTEQGAWVVEAKVRGVPVEDAVACLMLVGRTPLPPYILKARKAAGQATDLPDDPDRYQTVFAGATIAGGPTAGAVAAPTAGLHLTPGLLEELRARGVGVAEVVLQVGAGTFKPVETEFLEQHTMHAEWCRMPAETEARILACRAAGGRVICVGTTSARTVESVAQAREQGEPGNGWISTRLLISPGYRWRWTDGLLTNFHLPRSTLLALVASLFEEGVPALHRLYAEAIRERYRFFSYGDAMLVLPASHATARDQATGL
ncbi:MAG: tRNA preQ1(34) S-adenosylmethionine ribosyltransferase-isomerase QueA, partial [Phycisphaerales bacterium]